MLNNLPPNVVPITLSCAAANAAPLGASTSLEYLSPYLPGSWNFPSVVPAGYNFQLTDVIFTSKCVQPSQYGLWRNSYLILYGMTTVVDSQGGQQHFITPLTFPTGFRITGEFRNQSVEPQNLLCIVRGYLDPTNGPHAALHEQLRQQYSAQIQQRRHDDLAGKAWDG